MQINTKPHCDFTNYFVFLEKQRNSVKLCAIPLSFTNVSGPSRMTFGIFRAKTANSAQYVLVKKCEIGVKNCSKIMEKYFQMKCKIFLVDYSRYKID